MRLAIGHLPSPLTPHPKPLAPQVSCNGRLGAMRTTTEIANYQSEDGEDDRLKGWKWGFAEWTQSTGLGFRV